MLKIINMGKPVTGLAWENGEICKVGQKGVQKIEPYEEAGEMAMVLWFCVTWEDGTENRYNGKYIAGVTFK